ncbi:MAG: hypothetical protein ACYS9T_00855 [Planctomycetota bacterium]
MTEARGDFLKACRLTVLLAGLWLGLLAESWAYELRAGQVFVSADSRKMMLYDDKQLVFWDGLGTDANAVARVNCNNKRVIASRQGRYLAIAPAGAAQVVRVRIFDNSGKPVGEFTNSESYNLRSVSDAGPLVALGYEGLDIGSPSKLYDVNGVLLHDCRYGGIKFARDGTPIVSGLDPNTDRRSLSALDLAGGLVATYEIDEDKEVDRFDAAGADGPVFATLGPKGGVIAHTFLIWDPNEGGTREINLPDNKPGVVGHGFSTSPNGEYVSVTNGPKGLLLHAVSKKSFIYEKEFDIGIEGRSLKGFLDTAVDDKGRVLATGLCTDPSKSETEIGTSCFCFFDQTGEVVGSGLLGDFRERPGLQLLSDGGLAAFTGASIRIVRPDAKQDEPEVLTNLQGF